MIRTSRHWHTFLVTLTLLIAACLIAACGPAPTPTTPPPQATATNAAALPPTETETRPQTAVVPSATPIPPTTLPATTTEADADPTPTAAGTSVTGVEGGIIVYTDFSEGANLYALVQGNDPVRMTFSQGLSYGARWAPNGERISFFYVDGLTGAMDLWFFDVTVGSNAMPLTEGGGAATIDRVDWSANGRFLIYAAPQPDGTTSDIYRLDVDSGQVVNLTEDNQTSDSAPVWSPDGQSIAFVSDRAAPGQGADNIWVTDLNGEQVTQLTHPDENFGSEIAPAWSPDGSQIAFIRVGLAQAANALWTINADGTNATQRVELPGSPDSLAAPVWSPNGEWIAFHAGEADAYDVWLIPAQPTTAEEAINVSNLPGTETDISWSPDSQALIFTNTRDGILSQFIVNADGTGLGLLLDSGQAGLGQWSP